MSNPRTHIDSIRKDFEASQRVKDSLNNSVQALAKDLYSKDTHFIFELIQNAEDNTYRNDTPSLSFKLVRRDPTNTPAASGALIIQNNEMGFEPENVDAICAVGRTTKSKVKGYIGEKGIGFKSVFRITTIPHIFSNGYQFCLPEIDEETGLGYIVPGWVAEVPATIDQKLTTIILPLDKADFGYEKIEEMLRDIEPETILFLTQLKEIQSITESGDDLTILKDDHENPKIQLMIEGKKQGNSYSEINEFLMFAKTCVKPTDIYHEKRTNIDRRDVSIVFGVDDDQICSDKVFAYLPIRSGTGLPFLINADFILPSSREDIQDVPWNRWLMKCVAAVVADALPYLREKNLLTVDLLEKLASRMNTLSKDTENLYYPIAEAVRPELIQNDLLPAVGHTYVSARNAKLARGTDLRRLLSTDQLNHLFESNGEVKWLVETITRDLTPELRTYLLNELEVEEVSRDVFARHITEAFLENQTDEWFIAFYKYLSGRETLWRQRFVGDYNRGILRNKPILRLQDDNHVAPFLADGTPNAFLPPPEDTEFPVIKRCIYGDEQVADFMKRLGLSEPDVFDDIVERILPKYIQEGTQSILPSEHSEDIRKILRAMVADSESGKKKIIRAALDFPFLLAIDSNGDTSFKKPNEVYIDDEDLRCYFGECSDAWFLAEESPDALDSNDIWLELGVALHPRRKPFSGGLPSSEREYSTRDSSTENYELHGLCEFITTLATLADFDDIKRRSLILWDYLKGHLEINPRFFLGKHSWFYFNPHSKFFDSQMLTHLRESEWIPTVDETLTSPVNISSKQLCDEFSSASELQEVLGISKDSAEHDQELQHFAAELGVSLEDINFVRQNPEEFYQFRKECSARKEKPAFPIRPSTNPDRRREKVTEQIKTAPKKEYEKRERSVRTTRGTIDPVVWLRNQYKNEDGQVICQVCKEEMPFKKRDGELYIEAVEALSKDHFPVEHEAQFLALCPLCAAMYMEFVKQDNEIMVAIKNVLTNTNEFEVPLQLGELDTSIRFVETHFNDIRVILQKLK